MAKRALFLASVWPEYNSTAAGMRVWSLMNTAQKLGFNVTCASNASRGHHNSGIMKALDERTIASKPIELNSDSFDSFIHDLKPDVVVFDTFVKEEQFGSRVRKAAPHALRILDTQDLHFVRKYRESLVLNHQGSDSLDFRKIMDAKVTPEHSGAFKNVLRELASIHRSHLCWLVSPVEKALLENVYGINSKKLEIVSFFYPMLDTSKQATHPAFSLSKPQVVPFESRRNIVFLGGFRHKPNEDAVFFLRKQIWPLILEKFEQLQIPPPELHIYGSYATEKQYSLSRNCPSFIVKGSLSENRLYETLSSYRLMLAPLRFGAGVKGKISDSWFSGTPVVTSSIGAEGMRMSDFEETSHFEDWGGFEIETLEPKEYAYKTIQLYMSETLWNKFSQIGQTILHTHFSETMNEQRMEDSMSRLLQRTDVDWFHEILWREEIRSTEYFSKYLAIKQQFVQ